MLTPFPYGRYLWIASLSPSHVFVCPNERNGSIGASERTPSHHHHLTATPDTEERKEKGRKEWKGEGEDECSEVQSLWEFDFRLRGCALSEVELGRIPHQAGSRGENN